MAQAGGGAGGVAGAAAGAAAGACAWAYAASCGHAQEEAQQNPEGESKEPRTGEFLQRHGLTPVRIVAVRVLERRGVGLAGADAHGVIQIEDEDFSVADLSGLGGAGDGADDLVDLVGRHRRLRS